MRGDGITSASRRLRLGACTASSCRTLGFAGLVSIATEHLGEILADKINRHVRHIVRQRPSASLKRFCIPAPEKIEFVRPNPRLSRGKRWRDRWLEAIF
jgi:hypothetical protein